MYTDLVIEHFTNPRNVGTIENPDGYGKVESEDDVDAILDAIEDGEVAEDYVLT